ncbi:MAG: DUF559 domain-containing protein [Bacteroidota bacterium]
MPKHRYNRKLKPLARKLRNDSTPGEIRLWSEVLRARGFYGYQFNRQFPIGNYIVDFVCRKLKLVVELDGRSHQFTVEEDLRRDQYLKNLSYQVVRIAESDVMRDLPNVIRTLESYLPEEDR